VRAARKPRRLVDARRIRSEFVDRFLGGERELLRRHEREVDASGLRPHLFEKAREQQALVERSGEPYSLGAIGYAEGLYLYSIVRTLRPHVMVETGVANGFSTAFLLLALKANGEGELHSIDLPREVGKAYEPGTFYEGTGRAGIPPGRESGWLIPDELRDRWRLVVGRSQEQLPPLLRRLGAIDFFMHDSEHSFECMWFEFNAAWPALRAGGVLVSDDVNTTAAFPRFAQERGVEPVRLARGMAAVVKGP
jgi:predicted O-methyltransferase YrrM